MRPRKAARAGELALLYLAFPAAVALDLAQVDQRWLIWGVTAGYLFVVLHRRHPAPSSLGLRTRPARYPLLIAAAVTLALAALALGLALGWLQWRTAWVPFLIFVLYPAVSVPAQEFFFRSFFFYRYAPLLHPIALVALNALLFAAYHGIFGTWSVVAATLPAGVVLALLYSRVRNLFLCWLVHYGFGVAVYAVGGAEAFTTLRLFID